MTNLIAQYPELEGKIGYIQSDGTLDINSPTNNVKLPQGFHNIFGEDFDATAFEDISLADPTTLSNTANDALAYDRNRTEYEKVLLPYLEAKGLNIDAFNVTNEMLPYKTAQETALDLGIDYSKLRLEIFLNCKKELVKILHHLIKLIMHYLMQHSFLE